MKNIIIFLSFFNFVTIANATKGTTGLISQIPDTSNSSGYNLQHLCDAVFRVEASEAATANTDRLLLLCNSALQESAEKENRTQVNIPEIATTQEQPQKPDHVENEFLQTLRAQICRLQHINDPFFNLLSHPVDPQVLENLNRFNLTANPALLLWQIQREPNARLRTIFLDILEGKTKKDIKKQCKNVRYYIKKITETYSTDSIMANYDDAKDLLGFSQLVSLPEQVFEHLLYKKPREGLLSERMFQQLNNETNLKHIKFILLYLSGMSQIQIVEYCMEIPSILCYVFEKYEIPYEEKSRRVPHSVRNPMAKRVHHANQAAASSSGLATSE